MARNSDPSTERKVERRSVHVLLVEDNLAEARLLQEFLKGALLNGFHLSHVKRLQEAIERLHQSPWDVVLLDLSLPDSQGLESLQAVVQQMPSIPIVVLTNTNDDDLALAALRHGAQDYLFKRNVNQEMLVRSLRYAIERKQSAEALREANETLELRVRQRTAELETTNTLLKQEIEWRQRIQEKLELAQHAGKIGTFEWEIQSHKITWTAELEALYGLSPGSFNGRYEDWIATLHPDDRPRTEQTLWQAVKSGQAVDIEFRIVWTNQMIRWISLKSNIFQDETGKSLRMLGIHMDITEKKQLEEQFLRAQRLESLGTLASGIAHDLNNILTPILAIAQLLPLKFDHLNDHTRELLRMLEISARRGADLVKQILSFARGVEGKRVCLQINHLLLEVQQIIQQTFPKSITISSDIPADLWMISGDATQLHQVLMNLCVNARDAMPTGGSLQITARNLSMDEDQARLYLDAQVGAYVVVSVCDTGSGIAPELIDRIFDPFFTTKEIGKGTGLGLSAVLGIVKSHGGFVNVQSQVNQGSQFYIYLPATLSPVASPEADLEMLMGHQELVLVVDDEAMICDVIQTILETYHYRVLTATSGREAIAHYTDHHHELHSVLLDMMMPGMDGYHTLTALHQIDPQVPVVALSGLPSLEAIAQTESLGFQGFLHKPLHPQDLLQQLASLQRLQHQL